MTLNMFSRHDAICFAQSDGQEAYVHLVLWRTGLSESSNDQNRHLEASSALRNEPIVFINVSCCVT